MIDSNHARVGGGVSVYNAHLEMIGCAVRGNDADSDGGGLPCTEHSSAQVTGCEITGNATGNRGGGISVIESSNIQLIGSRI